MGLFNLFRKKKKPEYIFSVYPPPREQTMEYSTNDSYRTNMLLSGSNNDQTYDNKDHNYDNELDILQLFNSFDLFSSNYLLSRALEAYDQQATYDVCVLQFSQEIPVLHWSIYLQSNDDDIDGGPVYDVWYVVDLGRWQRMERNASKVTQFSSVWTGKAKGSSRYYGGTNLGRINDIRAFQRIVRSTEMPSEGENCQSWVEYVIFGAYYEGLLDRDALRELSRIPRYP